jgi:hypothetical protein
MENDEKLKGIAIVEAELP